MDSQQKIIVIDDQDSHLLYKKLKSTFDVTEVSQLSSCLELVPDSDVKLIAVDLNEIHNSLEVCADIKQETSVSKIPIILVAKTDEWSEA